MAASLAQQILAGDARALASAITLAENGAAGAEAVLKAIYPHTGRAQVIGVTGAAGTGKSSLIDRMTAEYRRRGKTVGILAVDPSSLFSNGALLGDRIRMRAHFADSAVFIRSFAARGAGGGVAAAVGDAIHLLDAAGKDVILVETIGVGQDELEIAALVHQVVAVLVPEMGDEVQAMKAGITEIADILVVNKTDLPGADITVQQLREIFDDGDIVPTSASHNDGIQGLIDTLARHQAESLGNGRYHKKRIELCRQELRSLLRRRLLKTLETRIDNNALDDRAKLIAERRIDPYTEVKKIARILGF